MSLMLPTNFRALLLTASVLTLAACPEKEQETDSGTDATTGTATDTTTSSTPTSTNTTTEVPTTGGTMTDSTTTTGETATTTASTTTEAVTEGTTTFETTTEGTTGEVPPELDAACGSACDKFFECIPMPPFPDIETCKADCAASLGPGEMCLQPTVEFNTCIGEMNCEQLEDAFVNEEFGPCTDEFEAMLESCQGDACQGFGSDGPPNVCSIGQMCPDVTEEFSCDGDTCTCLVDDQPMGMCPATPGFCQADFEDQAQAAFDCCGFEL